MRYRRMIMEVESPEELGYEAIDNNLAESSVRELDLADLDLDLEAEKPAYGDHAGSAELRALIADRTSGVGPEDVVVTAGAAMALFIVATTLLERGDRVAVERPNYASNLETPRAIGCAVDYMELRFEDAYVLDLGRVEAALRSGPRLVSVTTPHNPTGSRVGPRDMAELVELVERSGSHLLVDETYREMVPGEHAGPLAASLSARAISVSSLSKAYGLPGIRVGWLACQDHALREQFLAAKEQICLTGSILDEAVARAVLRDRERWIERSMHRIRTGVSLVRNWIARDDRFEWVPPVGGAVCFPRVRSSIRHEMGSFYDLLRERHRTVVGPGHWFEQPDQSMRIGYGWPEPGQLRAGLQAISEALDETDP